ncbi:MAG TPA: hypothetical protein VE641_18295 [Chthoniobacterales bacterium]|nr:hypothetical protein [Chthoniobacterales bacterium]
MSISLVEKEVNTDQWQSITNNKLLAGALRRDQVQICSFLNISGYDVARILQCVLEWR